MSHRQVLRPRRLPRRAGLPNAGCTSRRSGTTRKRTGCWPRHKSWTPIRSRTCCGNTMLDGHLTRVFRTLRIRMSRGFCHGSRPALCRRDGPDTAQGDRASDRPCERQTKEKRTMKLLRYGPAGQEKPGLLDADGRIRDLSSQIADLDGQALAPEMLARLAKLDPAALPVVDGSPRLGCPVGSVSKFIAVGLNYADHAAESARRATSSPSKHFQTGSLIRAHENSVVADAPMGAAHSHALPCRRRALLARHNKWTRRPVGPCGRDRP